MNDTVNFTELYNRQLKEFEKSLENYVDSVENQVLLEPLKYIMAGKGKRIRPMLVIFSNLAVGGRSEEAIAPAIAMEMLHNFTLAHDDIMDKSPLRRGKETIYKKWDEATAILLGDLMIGYAFGLLPNRETSTNNERILSRFNNALVEVCQGQALDMQFEQTESVSLEDYLKMIELKTAMLIEASCCIGALSGYGTKAEINSLIRYGNSLGLAFQIQDDLLDATAEFEKFGKRLGQDLLDGKKTFLILTAEKLAKEKDDVELIKKFYENKGVKEEDIPKMLEIYERLGVFQIAEQEIDNYTFKAKDSIKRLQDNIGKNMLYWIADLLNKRKT